MKNCQVCGLDCEDIVDSCDACGEASWAFSMDIVAEAPKKAPKKKPAKAVEAPVEAPVEEAPAAPQISDEEFAAELANASDVDLLALFGEENLSPAWRALVDAEIAKRGDK